jgi:hypothetical protein
MSNADAWPDMPEFLRRPAVTPEQRRRLDRMRVNDVERTIKNPPKRAKRKTKLLGFSPVKRGK